MNNTSIHKKEGSKCTAGRPALYKPEIHVPMIIESAMLGRSITQFCADAGIWRTTYYEWQARHKEFREAIKLAEVKREAKLDNRLTPGTEENDEVVLNNVPTSTLQMQRNVVLGNTRQADHVVDIGNAQSQDEKVDIVLRTFSNGFIDTNEAKELLNIIALAQQVKEGITNDEGLMWIRKFREKADEATSAYDK